MSKRLIPIALLCTLALLLSTSGVRSQPAEKPVFNGPPAPEQIKALAPFIGQWTTEATIKPTLIRKEGYAARGEMSCQWMHNGHFLRIEGFGLSKYGRFEHTTIVNYNRTTGVFRQFAFSSDGVVGEGVGEWDDKTQTLTMKGVNLPAGWTAVFTMALDKDRLVQTGLVKNEKGEVVRDVSVVCARKPATEQSLYHADPEHLWNRLHAGLFVRVGPDGRAYGQDRLEPLLWYGSKHLLEEKSHKRAVALLEEFLKNNGETLVDDPLKRAVLQRDLWLVFNWLEGSHGHFYEPELRPEEVQGARDRLRRPLAAVIGRLALAPDQIAKLPDNYAAAVASGEFAARFDPERPDQPYLPADLFAADGPWVCVGRPDGPVAPAHQRDEGLNVFTNSAFLVFLRLPAGRAAAVDYLNQLRSFDQPLLVEAKDPAIREKFLPNPKLPPLPAGADMALVRRALLISSTNTLGASCLTESVQLRRYREVPELTEQNVRAAVHASANSTNSDRRVEAWQSFQEFHLSCPRLFAGRAGGLRAVDPDELDFHSPFVGWLLDEFDNRETDQRGRPFAERNQGRVMRTCFQCHSLPGVASFNSYFNYRIQLHDRDAHPFSLLEMPISEVAGATVKWKQGRPSWTALRKLLDRST